MSNEMRAFPLETDTNVNQGMSLRDYFAAKALAGDMATHQFTTGSVNSFLDSRAELYYRMADAMMRMRNK